MLIEILIYKETFRNYIDAFFLLLIDFVSLSCPWSFSLHYVLVTLYLFNSKSVHLIHLMLFIKTR